MRNYRKTKKMGFTKHEIVFGAEFRRSPNKFVFGKFLDKIERKTEACVARAEIIVVDKQASRPTI